MTKSLLGLHIGCTDIRIASLSLTGSQPRVFGSMRLGLNGNESIADTAGRVLELVEKRGFKTGQVYLGINSKKGLIQKLRFPFTEVQKIKGVLPFELENHLPVKVADYVWDFFLSPRTQGEQGSEVIAILYPRQEVEEWVTQLELGGVSVLGVELDLSVLNSLAERYLVQDLDNFLLLDLDWRESKLVWRQGDVLQALRYIPVGIQDILSDVVVDADSSDQSELHKVLGELSEDQMHSLAQGPGAQNLMQQIKLTCMQVEHSSLPAGLFLSGMASLFDHFPPLLEDITGLKVIDCKSFEKRNLDKQGKEVAFQITVALGLKKNRGKKRFDLLPGIRSKGAGRTIQWKQFRFLTFSLACILICFAVSLSLDIYLKQQNLNKIRKRVDQTFARMVPDAGPGIQPMQYPGVVRSRIQQLQSGPSRETNPKQKVTRVLSTISKTLPKDLQLQINLWALDGLNVRMSGASPDFKTVDEIKNRLFEQDIFANVEIVGANVDQGGEGVSFSLRLTLDGPAGG